MRTKVCVVVLLAALCVGCSFAGERFSGRKISEVRPVAPKFQVINLIVQREQFLTALGREQENSQLRIVEVYFGPGQVSPAYPNYRIFGVHSASAHALIGLKNGDVLVAANGYVVASPAVFRQYVQLLSQEKEAEIEVIRQGNPTLLKISFVGGRGASATGAVSK